MKMKEISKKLVLNRKTIFNLKGNSLSGIIGGLSAYNNFPENDNCISGPWIGYTEHGFLSPTCDTCGTCT